MAILCRQLGYTATGEQMQRRLKHLLLDEDHAVCVAVAPDGHLVGWVHVHVPRLLLIDRRAEIGGLVVDAEYRRCGIGRSLMAQAEQWARARGCGLVHLRSNVSRKDAHLFYEGIGYRKLTTQLKYQKAV